MRFNSRIALLGTAVSAMFLLLFAVSNADIYRIVSEDGTILLTNMPPLDAGRKIERRELTPDAESDQVKQSFRSASFIQTRLNDIHNDEPGLEPFYKKLLSLQNNRKNNVVIYQVGDSHVRSVFFPKQMAQLIQGRFGANGGGIFYSDPGKKKGPAASREMQTISSRDLTAVPFSENPSSRGVKYFAYGISGKTFGYFVGSEVLFEQLQSYRPDLVILSLGTNEAFAPSFKREGVLADIRALTGRIRAILPDAQFLFTIPPDSCWKSGEVNTNVRDVREVIIAFCREHNYSYWDLYSVMGGERSMERWHNNGLAGDDKVHFKAVGYRMQGELFYQALMSGFNRFVHRSDNTAS